MACFALWVLALGVSLDLVRLAEILRLSLKPFFALAAALGWLSGNVYVQRTRGMPKPLRRRVVWLYLLGPAALPHIAWAMNTPTLRGAAPLAPVWATGVLIVFFLVPVTFRTSGRR